jgi:hypothetical protein
MDTLVEYAGPDACGGPLARLTLNSPHNRNALSTALVSQLHEGLSQLFGFDPKLCGVAVRASDVGAGGLAAVEAGRTRSACWPVVGVAERFAWVVVACQISARVFERRPQVVHVVDRIPVSTWHRPLASALAAHGRPAPGPDVYELNLVTGAYRADRFYGTIEGSLIRTRRSATSLASHVDEAVAKGAKC